MFVTLCERSAQCKACAAALGRRLPGLPAAFSSLIYVRLRTDGAGEREIIGATMQGLENGKTYCDRDRLSTDRKESEMDRNRIENYWKQLTDNADEQSWDEFAIDDQVVSSIRESYGIADDETECQLADWQARLK